MHRSFRFAALSVRMTFLVFLLLASTASFAQRAGASEKLAIRGLLEKQVDAWNRGDLEGFMAGYWKSPELTMYSGPNVIAGWDKILERYRQRYQAEGKEMGKLDFFDLRVGILAPDAAWVEGHWHLKMKNGEEPGGLFTLILRKFPHGWKIVHDHTS